MQFTPELIQGVQSLLGLCATVVVAGAGAWKYLAWLKDRREQAQIDSASFFLKEGVEDWQRELGRQEMVRIHFARLKGVDIASGHQSVMALHQHMGGDRFDWEALAKAQDFLDTSAPVAEVQRLTPKNHWRAALVAGLMSVAIVVALVLLLGTVNWSMKHHWTQMSLNQAVWVVIALVYSGFFGLISYVCYVILDRYQTAWRLRRRLDKLVAKDSSSIGMVAEDFAGGGAAGSGAPERAGPGEPAE